MHWCCWHQWSKCSAVAEMGDRLATTDMGWKLGAVPLGEGEWVSILHNVARAEAYLPTKWHLDPFSHFATTGMGRKLGELCPFGVGELGPHLTQCGLGWGLTSYQAASWSIHNRHDWIVLVGGSCALLGRGAGSPFNTIWQRLRPTSMPSFFLIHTAVWLQ